MRENWDDKAIINTYNEILKFQSPFSNKTDSFEIKFNVPDNKLIENQLSIDKILDYSLWNAEILIQPTEDKGTLHFNFTPYREMKSLSNKSSSISIEYCQKKAKEVLPIDISKYKIGPIKIKLYAYHRSTAVLKMLKNKRKDLKDYLDENGGIRVYRGTQRIYNYGSKDEDWLGLNLKRLNSPGSKLSKNILIGVVEISDDSSSDLIEKTNREGFIENDAFLEFKKIVSLIVDEFAFLIIPTKDNIKALFDKNLKQEKINDTFSELIEEVENAKFNSPNEKEKIMALINTASEQYNESKKILLSVANTSVDYHMVFHDVDKQIQLLIKLIDNHASINDISKLAYDISDIISLQKDLITNRDFSKINFLNIYKKFKHYAKYRLQDHNIVLIEEVEDHSFTCIESQILRVLINLFDNSVYWLNFNGNDKKIFIKSYLKEKRFYIVFADNGPGFGTTDTANLFKPFVTKKQEGLGLGLYIVNEIMDIHEGSIQVIDSENELLPSEFREGAKFIISLKG